MKAAERAQWANVIYERLDREYPDARCSLDFRNPFELIAATILSAQCTDVMVNKVTPELFRRYPTPEKMAVARAEAVETLIQPTGFYRAKAKSLQEMSRALVRDHGGEVPREMDALVKLRGVGRKTANVVLGNGFGLPGLPVDTHVMRLTKRLGLTRSEDAVKIEYELHTMLAPTRWARFSNLLIWHGRKICGARKPLCDVCLLRDRCPTGLKAAERA